MAERVSSVSPRQRLAAAQPRQCRVAFGAQSEELLDSIRLLEIQGNLSPDRDCLRRLETATPRELIPLPRASPSSVRSPQEPAETSGPPDRPRYSETAT